MFVLARRLEETIVISEEITVKILRVGGSMVKVGIDAPENMTIRKGEQSGSVKLPSTIREMELRMVKSAIMRHYGDRDAAAKELGVNLTWLSKKLDEIQKSEPPKTEFIASKSTPIDDRTSRIFGRQLAMAGR